MWLGVAQTGVQRPTCCSCGAACGTNGDNSNVLLRELHQAVVEVQRWTLESNVYRNATATGETRALVRRLGKMAHVPHQCLSFCLPSTATAGGPEGGQSFAGLQRIAINSAGWPITASAFQLWGSSPGARNPYRAAMAACSGRARRLNVTLVIANVNAIGCQVHRKWLRVRRSGAGWGLV